MCKTFTKFVDIYLILLLNCSSHFMFNYRKGKSIAKNAENKRRIIGK